MKRLSDAELATRTDQFLEKLAKGKALENILVQAFAVVRETACRQVEMTHREKQVQAAVELAQGKVIEMDNGEGKTLVATMPVYLCALKKEGVHVATYNDYLVRRDALWMGPIYEFLGLSVGLLQEEGAALRLIKATDESYDLKPCSRKEVYLCDITYGTYQEFVSDYLRDHTGIDQARHTRQRGHRFMFLDEADYVLVDAARTPTVIVGDRARYPPYQFKVPFRIARQLQPGVHFIVHKESNSISISDRGAREIERIAGIPRLYSVETAGLANQIIQSLKAIHLVGEESYFVRDEQIHWIDRDTGRAKPLVADMNGLRHALEIKEGIRLKPTLSKRLNEISYQQFFKLYSFLGGMSATAKWREDELRDVYGLEVVKIPPEEPSKRIKLDDPIFLSERAKLKAAVNLIRDVHSSKLPILVDAITERRAEDISQMLRKESVAHNLLTAKNDEEEAQKIKNAGQLGMVTITTRTAGRGTDIKVSKEAREIRHELQLYEQSKTIGGLFVLGLERQEGRHRDMQLQGRTGRQGQPGAAVFFLALTDELIERFGGETLDRLKDWIPEDEPLTSLTSLKVPLLNVNENIERAQRRFEKLHAKMRDRAYRFDRVLDGQRRFIFSMRDRVLNEDEPSDVAAVMLTNLIARIVEKTLSPPRDLSERERIRKLCRALEGLDPSLDQEEIFESIPKRNPEVMKAWAVELFNGSLLRIQNAFGVQNYRRVARKAILEVLDRHWRAHLQNIRDLHSLLFLVRGRSITQLAWFTVEANEAFRQVLHSVERSVIASLLQLTSRRETYYVPDTWLEKK